MDAYRKMRQREISQDALDHTEQKLLAAFGRGAERCGASACRRRSRLSAGSAGFAADIPAQFNMPMCPAAPRLIAWKNTTPAPPQMEVLEGGSLGPQRRFQASLGRSCCALASERSLVKDQQPTACSMHPDRTSQCHPGLAYGCGPCGQPVRRQGNFGRKRTDYEVVDARVEARLAGQGGNDGGSVVDTPRASELDELVCKERSHRFRR
jgi:hypothetical protein